MKTKIIETRLTACKLEELDDKYKLLIEEAKRQTEKSYAPYSNFNVGAAVLLANGTVVAANNQENAAYPSGLCAERVAMFYANAQYPDLVIEAIAVAASTRSGFLVEPISPCGACRQVLLESEVRNKGKIKVLLYGEKEVLMLDCVKDLLPFSFVKDSLSEAGQG